MSWRIVYTSIKRFVLSDCFSIVKFVRFLKLYCHWIYPLCDYSEFFGIQECPCVLFRLNG